MDSESINLNQNRATKCTENPTPFAYPNLLLNNIPLKANDSKTSEKEKISAKSLFGVKSLKIQQQSPPMSPLQLDTVTLNNSNKLASYSNL